MTFPLHCFQFINRLEEFDENPSGPTPKDLVQFICDFTLVAEHLKSVQRSILKEKITLTCTLCSTNLKEFLDQDDPLPFDTLIEKFRLLFNSLIASILFKEKFLSKDPVNFDFKLLSQSFEKIEIFLQKEKEYLQTTPPSQISYPIKEDLSPSSIQKIFEQASSQMQGPDETIEPLALNVLSAAKSALKMQNLTICFLWKVFYNLYGLRLNLKITSDNFKRRKPFLELIVTQGEELICRLKASIQALEAKTSP